MGKTSPAVRGRTDRDASDTHNIPPRKETETLGHLLVGVEHHTSRVMWLVIRLTKQDVWFILIKNSPIHRSCKWHRSLDYACVHVNFGASRLYANSLDR
ncbi:hypothetical protein TNCT_186821 [Trichonephila clavata]|uniref:Uncharacterized protein n=1 Tax=Trichonephila clavata TaxID=2740835 RepID=A0A8X6LFE4_TRICU|nr:hypothetical protein TNCT_186821 [Trichonephila clavata]